jgi:hypothetical protein
MSYSASRTWTLRTPAFTAQPLDVFSCARAAVIALWLAHLAALALSCRMALSNAVKTLPGSSE